jgi:DNA-binding CsgD family transcriptional regulator
MTTNHPKPRIVIIDGNILSAIGLKGMLETAAPGVETVICQNLETLQGLPPGHTVHYFVASSQLFAHHDYFLPMTDKVIVLIQGSNNSLHGFRTLDVTLPEPLFLKLLLAIHDQGHGHQGHRHPDRIYRETDLTRREKDVLRKAVLGFQNKEMADQFHVEVTTIVFHRKNIAKKLGTKSLSSWTIHAVVNGLVQIEEIA